MLGQKKSLGNILKVFNKTVADLDLLMEQNTQIAQQQLQIIEEAKGKLGAAEDESKQAEKVKEKLKEFTSV